MDCRVKACAAGTPASPSKRVPENCEKTAVPLTGWVEVMVPKPTSVAAPAPIETNFLVCPPATWKPRVLPPPTGVPLLSTNERLKAVPADLVNVIVTLARFEPFEAGFVIKRVVLQPPPSATCGKYEVVCAEQITAEIKRNTRDKNARFILTLLLRTVGRQNHRGGVPRFCRIHLT